MTMNSSMSMSDYSSFSVSPLTKTALHGDFQSYVNVKTEIDHSYSPVHHHVCSPSHGHSFQNNPHSLSSCMYAASVSPCMMSSTSPDHCASIVSAKENNSFRGVPACRRRLDFNHNAFLDVTKVGPVAVAKRNERERNRVKLINMTFQTLRQHLPLGSCGIKGKSRKLSKVQTLRSAIDYIRQLQDMVHSRQQQKQIEFRAKGEDDKTSLLLCSDFKSSYQGNSIELRSPSKEDDPKAYFVCQTICGNISVPMSEDESLQTGIASSKLQTGGTASSVITNCNIQSPYSDASSYDAVTTPEDDEYIDFDDWF